MSDKKSQVLTLNFNADDLSDAQIRLVRSVAVQLSDVVSSKEEGEFFDSSAELMRTCAALIKEASFVRKRKDSEIPYGDQAVEFSIDVLSDCVSSSKVQRFDN